MLNLRYFEENLEHADALGAIYLKENNINSFDDMNQRQKTEFRSVTLCNYRKIRYTATEFKAVRANYNELLKSESLIRLLNMREHYVSFANYFLHGECWPMPNGRTSFAEELQALDKGFADEQELFSWANELIATLNEREQAVIRLRFGLGDGRVRDLRETAKALKVTRERVRQIEAKAFRKMRRPMVVQKHEEKMKELPNVKPEDPIDVLDFSIRTFNCLCKAEIRTVAQLIEKIGTVKEPADIYPLLGKKGLEEITKTLERLEQAKLAPAAE